MPSFRSGTARRRRGIAAVIGMFVSLLALVLALPGAASAASGNGDGGTKSAKATTPGKASESAKSTEGLRGNPKAPAKRGEAWMGAGVRMHEGDSTDGTQPDKNRAGLLASVHGVDVSSHQGNVAWSTLWNSGVRFAYAKATEGTSYKRNPYFAQQYNGSYNVGMIRGAYHFALPNSSSGATQANYFASNGGGWSKDGKTLPGRTRHRVQPLRGDLLRPEQERDGELDQGLHQHLQGADRPRRGHLHHHELVDPVHRQQQCLRELQPALDRPLRLLAGTLPAGWGFYTPFWQYTSSGPTVGDHDYFNGSMTRLKVLANGG